MNESWSSGGRLLSSRMRAVDVMDEVVQVAVGDMNKTQAWHKTGALVCFRVPIRSGRYERTSHLKTIKIVTVKRII